MTSRRRNLIVLAIVVVLTALSAVVIATKETVLGLDLSGGTELVYQASGTPQNPDPSPADIESAISIIRERTDSLGVSEPEISRIGPQGISVGLPNVENADRAIEQVGTTAKLYLYDFTKDLIPSDPKLPNPEERPFNRLYDAVKFAGKQSFDCGDLCTTTGPTWYLFDKASLEPYAGPVADEKDLYAALPEGVSRDDTVALSVPKGITVVQREPQETGAEPPQQWYVLKDAPEVNGDQITDPKPNFDQNNQPVVTFDFTDEGREGFSTVTRRIATRAAAQAPPTICSGDITAADQYSQTFAIVLDNEIRSRPFVNFCENPEGIDGRTGAQISGLTQEESTDLAETLKIGALPVTLSLESTSTVSATLGQQALDQGLKAGLAGLVLVMLFLLAYYRFLGLVAAIGLVVYGIFFYALIKLIPITLTLPGIAGLILTIGVAADANVVIFERIKEEARAGKSLASAIATGYRKGIATIVDANVITLITAFILFVLATAGVKGFAFTLGIGTIVSLFTAVLFTQAFLAMFGRAGFMRSPRVLGAGEQRVKWNFDFMGASKWFFSISGAILAIGALAFATKQLNLGIDFESGTKIEASLSQDASIDEIRGALQDANLAGADNAEILEVDNPDLGENVIDIKGNFSQQDAASVQPVLDREFGLTQGGFSNQTIGPTFGEQVARGAIIAIIFSLLVISAYVAIRFEAKYAVPVIIALIHDILITGGVYALVGQEVTSGTVAAFLTILGYSMYDTVIVLDRIRENVPRMPRAAFSQIVNRSMSEVLTRSLITGLSTVFLIGVLLAFGGDTLRDFAFAMMVGVASGTYSSIFIASPVLTHWKEREPAYRSRRARIREAMGYVPTFPEDNVVARIDEVERHAPEHEPAAVGAGAEQVAAPAAPAEPAETPPTATEPAAPAAGDGAGDGAPAAPVEPEPTEPLSAGAEARRKGAERRKARQQKRRRKHGRPR
jgi:SecD/SecF fusion protein